MYIYIDIYYIYVFNDLSDKIKGNFVRINASTIEMEKRGYIFLIIIML